MLNKVCKIQCARSILGTDGAEVEGLKITFKSSDQNWHRSLSAGQWRPLALSLLVNFPTFCFAGDQCTKGLLHSKAQKEMRKKYVLAILQSIVQRELIRTFSREVSESCCLRIFVFFAMLMESLQRQRMYSFSTSD